MNLSDAIDATADAWNALVPGWGCGDLLRDTFHDVLVIIRQHNAQIAAVEHELAYYRSNA
ncbi:hypothetical protein CKJ63_03520 [Mycobacterium avium]|uniref:hypothetical protein n=1 Tax=Mycobacterium avium TaxID=1764 RepID=UPI000BAF6B3F|nr:hypothetical protein [Mycobacterium avium]PBA43541.1 hypothetical protein CKJ63_03520 [Mycobacterium avium]PBA85430.1 hypothetical protein CKJ72_03905 [Mycobacterium avium]